MNAHEILANPADAALPADRAEFDLILAKMVALLANTRDIDIDTAFFVYLDRLPPELRVRAMFRALDKVGMILARHRCFVPFANRHKEMLVSPEGEAILQEERERTR